MITLIKRITLEQHEIHARVALVVHVERLAQQTVHLRPVGRPRVALLTETRGEVRK